jgi:hypothetical protein
MKLQTAFPRLTASIERPAIIAPASLATIPALILLCLLCQACSGGSGDNGAGSVPDMHADAAQGSVTVMPSVSSIEIGQTRSYTAVVKDGNGNILNGTTVVWASSHSGVATIDRNGVARGLSAGTTTITASRNGVTSQLVNLSVTTAPVSALTPLPPWLTYCDAEPCTAIAPVVIDVCSSDSAQCTPVRSTRIVAQVDDKPISGVFFTVAAPADIAVTLASGNGLVSSPLVWAYQASTITLASDLDVLLSYYDLAPVWGGTTPLKFTSTLLTSALMDTVFYRHPSYDTGDAATQLHTQGQAVITAERAITGLTSEHVTAFFIPSELAVEGEGNFSYGNGTVTINYGNPPYIAAQGGIPNAAIPRFAHEYTHELFNEISPAPAGDPSCFNEGVADAVAWFSGFLPEDQFGPVGVRGIDFDSSCAALGEIHDVGNCYFWHVKKAGLLTQSFLHGIFHPQRAYSFNSCAQNTTDTGNAILVYFTEAAGGADMLAVLDSMQIPHAASYEAAKQALGL